MNRRSSRKRMDSRVKRARKQEPGLTARINPKTGKYEQSGNRALRRKDAAQARKLQ